MNIVVQCCGVALMVILLYFYSRGIKLGLYTERAFQRLMNVTMLALLLDILSNYFIVNRGITVPELATEVVCKAYLISLITLPLCGLSYICADIYEDRKKFMKMAKIHFVIYMISVITIIFTEIKYHYVADIKELYTYGPSVICTYAFAGFLILDTIVLMVLHRDSLNPLRRRAMFVWMAIWLGSAVIQFFNNQLLVVGMGAVLGCTVVYLLLENPDSNRDRNTGLFNQNALLQYFKQLYNQGDSFSVMTILLEVSEYMEDGKITDSSARFDLLTYIAGLKDANAFTNAEDEVVLVFAKQEDFHALRENIEKRFNHGWGKNRVFIKPYFINIPDSKVASNTDNLLYYMKYVRYYIKKHNDCGVMYVDEALSNKVHHELAIEKTLAIALEKDKVDVFYQPIYSIKEKRFNSAEALVRLYDENGNIVMPGDFIPIAEKNGMILRLGETVFRKVCEFISSDEFLGLNIDYIEVNLSVEQCSYEFLARDYIDIMRQYGVEPKRINLEITESAVLSAKGTLLANLEALQKEGVTFSLDDFGTGQSNLNYIVDMPVDVVKFDRGMTQAYFESEKAKYVMNAAMGMIQGMGLMIVSEGVETKEQYELLEELNIDLIQGYYFSKPIPKDEFVTFIMENH